MEEQSAELDIRKKAMIEALESSLGIVTTACKAVGINRQTHYNWLANDPAYSSAVADVQEIALDFAESKLHNRIASEDTTATIFYLKTKGKKRGYIERTELSGPDGDPITLAFEKVPSFMREIETKQNGVKESPKGIMTKGGFIPQ